MIRIKTFEKFEKLEDFPRVGNYVFLETDFYNPKLQDFFTNHVGKIIRISNRINPIQETIEVKYENSDVPDDLETYFRYNEIDGYVKGFNLDQIEFFSKNKEDVEAYIQSKKYNL